MEDDLIYCSNHMPQLKLTSKQYTNLTSIITNNDKGIIRCFSGGKIVGEFSHYPFHTNNVRYYDIDTGEELVDYQENSKNN